MCFLFHVDLVTDFFHFTQTHQTTLTTSTIHCYTKSHLHHRTLPVVTLACFFIDINMVDRSAKVVQPLRSPEAHSGKFVKGHGFETCSPLRAKSVQSLIRVFVTLQFNLVNFPKGSLWLASSPNQTFI
jgi:hypothetical protein